LAFLTRILEERWLYWLGWAGLACGLALGRAILSISIIVLAGAWLFDGLYRKDILKKWKAFLSHRPALLISSIPIIYAISLLYSSGIHEGLSVLRTQAPLLVLPMILSSMPKLKADHIKRIAMIHVAALLLSTLLSYFMADASVISETPRQIPIFVNHIRMALLLVMGIFLILRFNSSKDPLRMFINLSAIAWFLYFLWIMQAATGFSILLLVLFFYGLRSLFVSGGRKWLGILSLLCVSLCGYYVISSANAYWASPLVSLAELDTHTTLGNEYIHVIENKSLENGHRIWLYIAYNEMMEAWTERSAVDINGKDKKGQPIRGTLLRYLTSLDLRKDAAGVAALTDDQIKEIEEGITSALAQEHSGIRKRLDVLFFELDSYVNGGDPSYNSMTRRFEYWKAGWGLFKRSPIIGYGAGNLREDLKPEFIKNSRLSEDAWNLIHNQFLTFLACFGILGFIWMIYVHYMPLGIVFLRKECLLWVFLFVLCASYMTEDTLNTQAGLSFFFFYQGLLILGVYRPTESKTSS
jgi:hypothetical protein